MASPRPAPGRTALFVLGAPGCGAATLARVLEAAGAAALADPDAVAAFNDRRLLAEGAGWADPFGPRPREGGAASEPADGEVAEARALLRTAEPHQPLLVLADPRHTRSAALWTAALEAEGWRTGFILLVRAPGSAAAALKAAEGVTRNRGLLLWGSYMLEAERVARGGRRVAVAYERLAADPEGELDRIERSLDVRLPRRTWDSAAEIEALLRDGPSPAVPSGLPPALAPLQDLHAHLQAAAQDEPENTDTAAETARWFASLTDVMGPVLHQVRREAGDAAPRKEDPTPRAELDAARTAAQDAAARAEDAEARVEILQAALAVARRRSAEAEALLQARATEASAGERDARAALAAAVSARDAAHAERDGLNGELDLARGAKADLEVRLSRAEAHASAVEAAVEDERERHGEARERLALTGLSNLAAQARVRELQSQVDEVREELDRRRRWLPRLFGLR